MKRIVMVFMMGMLLGLASLAVAGDGDEFWVAGTVNNQTWEGFFATSAVSPQQAEDMAVRKCGGSDYCLDKVMSIERGCITYAESAEHWGMAARPTAQESLTAAVDACVNGSQNHLPCYVTGMYCADR